VIAAASVAAPPPSRHRVAILTWVGIWPTVSLLLYFGSPHLTAVPFLLRTAAITATAVAAMSYAVMPALMRAAGPWLRRSGRPRVSAD
jgi:hypothetical protein